MQDIDKLSLISVNYNTMHRQVAKDDSVHNSESPRQTGGGKCEQFKGKKQEAEAQSTQNADNTPKPPIVTNPMVVGNNNNNELIADLIADIRNNDSIDFLPELLNNHNLISDADSKDDVMTKTCKLIVMVSISFQSYSLIRALFQLKSKENDMTTQNAKINNNENESLTIDIVTDIGMEAQTMQKKKKRK